MDKLSKTCEVCGESIVYKNKNSYRSNKNKKSPCKKCKYRQHSDKLSGKKRPQFSEEWRKNLSESHKNSEVWKQSMASMEYKEKQRISKLGIKNGMFNKTHSDRTKSIISKALTKRMSIQSNIEKLKNRQWTDDQKLKHKTAINDPDRLKLLREHRLNQIKQSGGIVSFNRKACKFFDILNEKLRLTGRHALNSGEVQICGYSIDYFDVENNIIIEWDEKYHYKKDGSLRDKDLIRQSNILSKTKCAFYRISETKKYVYRVDNHIDVDLTHQIQKILNEYK